MIDRVSLAGLGGTFASFSLANLHTIIGILAGLATLVYMVLKIRDTLRKR